MELGLAIPGLSSDHVRHKLIKRVREQMHVLEMGRKFLKVEGQNASARPHLVTRL